MQVGESIPGIVCSTSREKRLNSRGTVVFKALSRTPGSIFMTGGMARELVKLERDVAGAAAPLVVLVFCTRG